MARSSRSAPIAPADAPTPEAPAAESEPTLEQPRHPRNASISLRLFLNACYSFIPDLSATELAKAEEVFQQCAKEARKRAEKKKAAECAAPKASAA
jgi:hypothetical protein